MFQVETYSSGTIVGAFFSQYERRVAYFNEKLNEIKQKYSSYDKELYVVLQALKKWRHYLIPKEFVLYFENHA